MGRSHLVGGHLSPPLLPWDGALQPVHPLSLWWYPGHGLWMLAYSLHHFGHDPPSFLPTNATEGNKKLLCAFYARYEYPMLFWAALSPTCQAPHLAFAALAPYSWMGDCHFPPAHAFGSRTSLFWSRASSKSIWNSYHLLPQTNTEYQYIPGSQQRRGALNSSHVPRKHNIIFKNYFTAPWRSILWVTRILSHEFEYYQTMTLLCQQRSI